MLPGKLDMSRDECRKYLRSLELDAYASIVSVLRAQGPFTNDKRKLLQELAGVLHISNERHRAEIRRAVNDDKLTNVAEQLSGPNTGTDWAIEGRRIVPLLPRLKGRSAFTTLANTLSLVTAIANKQQPRIEERAKDSRLKMETDSGVQQIFSSEEESCGFSSREPETTFNDRKRKRSLTESSDTEGSTGSNTRVKQKSKSSVVVNSSKEELKFPSFPSCSEVTVIPPSSALDELRHSTFNKTSMENIISIPSSTTNIVTTNITVTPPGVSNVGINSTAPCKNASNIATAQISQFISESIPTVKCKVNVLSPQVKAVGVSSRRISVTLPSSTVHPSTSDELSESQNAQANSEKGSKLVPMMNNVPKIDMLSSEDTSMSRPCVKIFETVVQINANAMKEKETISNIDARLMCVSSESTTSSGPGPPSVKPSSANLTCKTLPPVKPNNYPPIKMTPLISKATSINSQPNARFGNKRNFIVLQKSMNEVKLSHGGKEVIGKVIGNNFRFANQPNQSSVPRLPSNNGDHSDLECIKPNSKSGNMILLDIRPDILEKSKVFSQSFDTPVALDSEAKIVTVKPTANFTIKDQRNNGPSIIEKDSQLNDTSVSHVSNENEESFVYEDTDITKAFEKAVDNEPLFICNDEGTLDPQTGIYEIQSSDDAICNIQYEETLSSAGHGIFNSTLASENINLTISECVEIDNTRYVSEEARNSMKP